MNNKYTLNLSQTNNLIYKNGTHFMKYFNPDRNRRWKCCTDPAWVAECETQGEIAWVIDGGVGELALLIEKSYPQYVVEGIYFDDYRKVFEANNGVVSLGEWQRKMSYTLTPQQKFSAIAIRHKDAPFYNSIVTCSEEPNQFGTHTNRWYVASPFIARDRAHGEYITPSSVFARGSIKTNDIKKALKQVMSLPHLTFPTIIPAIFYSQDVSTELNEIQQADITDYLNKTKEVFYSLSRQGTSKNNTAEEFIEFTSKLARLLTGEADIQREDVLPDTFNTMQTYLEETKELAAYVETSKKQTHVYIGQATENSPLYCFHVGMGKVEYRDLEMLAAYKEFSSPYLLPECIKAKLATLEINKDNLETTGGFGSVWDYLPNIGAVTRTPWGDIKLYVMFLTQEEMGEVLG